MMSGVLTPGFQASWPQSQDLRVDAPGQVGIVLEVYGPGPTSVIRGPRCSVLLIESMRVVRDVIIPCQGGGARNVQAVTPSVTAPDLLATVQEAMQGNGVMPMISGPDERWGSWVALGRLATGQRIINHYLYHPALAQKRAPRIAVGDSPGDDASDTAGSILRCSEDNLPSAISDPDSVPSGTPPMVYAAGARVLTDAWQAAYRAGWIAGAEAGYLGQTTPASDPRFADLVLGPAQEDGWRTGWQDGYRTGQTVALTDPVDPPVAMAPVDPPREVPADPGDDDSDGAHPATTDDDDHFLEHFGNRIVLYKDGGIRIDTRAAGPIQIQAGSGGARITAGGAIVDVGAEGKSVVVTADTVVLAGRAAHAILGEPAIEFLLSHRHVETGGETLPPTGAPSPGDLLSDAVVLE